MSENLVSDVQKPGRSRVAGIVNGGVFLGVLALGVVIYLTPLKTWLDQGQLIKAQLALFGIAAPLVFTLAAAVLTAVGAPRLLLCSLGGMAFGFAWGLLWTQLATLIGSYATFLFVRWRGQDYAFDHFPRLKSLSRNMQNRGVMSVVLARQLPLHGFYNNVLLGLAPVSHGAFLFGSFLGYLPLGITACLLGAGLIQGDLVKGVQYISLALAASVILGILLNYLVKRKGGVGVDGAA